MYLSKRTNYLSTISTSDEEEDLIASNKLAGFIITSPIGIVQVKVKDLGDPYRIPIMDEETGEFKSTSVYSIRTFKMPPGSYNGLKVYSKEEIEAFNAARNRK